MHHAAILSTLKALLKKKNISYSLLGKRIGMSESGVKKLLTAKDISLGRIQQIADSLQISLADIFYLSENQKIQELQFSAIQEKAFYENPQLFRVLWYLSIENRTAIEIQKKEHLSELQWRKILTSLEAIQLLKVIPGNGFEFAHSGLFRWSRESTFIRKLSDDWSIATLRKVLKKTEDPKYYHRLGYLMLHPKTRDNYQRRLTELMDEAARAGSQEKLEFPHNQLEPLSFLIALAPSGFLDP